MTIFLHERGHLLPLLEISYIKISLKTKRLKVDFTLIKGAQYDIFPVLLNFFSYILKKKAPWHELPESFANHLYQV